VLARAGLGNHAMLAHALGQEALAERVVDLVRTGVQQVFALQVNLRAAQLFSQPFTEGKRRRTPGVVRQQIGQLRLKGRVNLGQVVRAIQFVQRRHQRLRHVPPAISAKAPWPQRGWIRLGWGWSRGFRDRCHEEASCASAQKWGELFSVLGAPIHQYCLPRLACHSERSVAKSKDLRLLSGCNLAMEL
jgi:hypothetical protein